MDPFFPLTSSVLQPQELEIISRKQGTSHPSWDGSHSVGCLEDTQNHLHHLI